MHLPNGVIVMNRIHIVSATTMFAFSLVLAGAARAEGSLASVETPQVARVLVANSTVEQGGSEAYPVFLPGRSVPVIAGTGILAPSTSGDGPVQTIASLPSGFTDRGVAMARADQSHATFHRG
jgi:hypothetical protein